VLRRADGAAARLEHKLREIGGLGLVALGLFLLVAVATFRYDYGGAGSGPGVANLCGFVGHRVARGSVYLFGSAAFVLYSCISVWGIFVLLRRSVVGWVSKSVGLLVLTVALSVLLGHLRTLEESIGPSRPMGWAGLVGHSVAPLLGQALGNFGTYLAIALILSISALLATDFAFYPILAALLRKERPGPATRGRKTLLGSAFAGIRAVGGWIARRRAGVAGEPEVVRGSLAPARPAAERPIVLQPASARTGEAKAEKGADPKPEPPAASRLAGENGGAKKAPIPEKREGAKGGSASAAPRPRKPDLATLPFPFKSRFVLPSLDLLDAPARARASLDAEIAANAGTIEQALTSFRIEARVVAAEEGPVVTFYELELASGVKVSSLASLADDLAIKLKAGSVRVVAPIPGKSTVGLEVPNSVRRIVRLRELIEFDPDRARSAALPLFLARDISGRTVVDDLAGMPHLLVAGATGSGKSVCVNGIILSLLLTRTPEECRFILIDPKMVELQAFRGIPHLLCPVVTNMRKAPGILDWACGQMDERYDLLSRTGVKHITDYNALGEKELRARLVDGFDPEKTPARLPYVVIVVDELADLMLIAAKEVETSITRLAQKSRAVGIHLVLATQRPSTNVITGLIKANLPTRVAFQVAAKVDSRVVLDANGAEKLLGQGDMLYSPPRASILVRAQGAFVTDGEVRRVTAFLADQGGPEFSPELVQVPAGGGPPQAGLEDEEEFEGPDPLYDDAVRVVIDSQRGSASLLQRALAIGYTRASRLIDRMGEDGVVGKFVGSKAREVLLTVEEWEARRRDAGAAPAPAPVTEGEAPK
jgi:DNA segregation ATPase FtsK/SpoIIIE, S-DNA-T family